MIAINFSTARGRLKDFCDRVTDRGETVIVTRKAEKNVVIISEERFNELEKAERNAAYLGKLERGLEQVLPQNGSNTLYLLLFSVAFFAAALFFALRPGKILTWVGKILNPCFLVFLGILVVVALRSRKGRPPR